MPNFTKTLQADRQVEPLSIQGFRGLSLKLDFVNRPKESFQQLDNVDLYVPGSIRKVLPAVLYGGPYGMTGTTNLLNCTEYLAQPNNPKGGTRRVIGLGTDGKLYDLASLTPAAFYADTSTFLGVPASIPFMFQESGFFVPYNVRSWQKNTAYALNDAVVEYSPTDGQLYVFFVSVAGTSSNVVEPTWPKTGTVVDSGVTWTNGGKPNSQRFLANYLYIILPGVAGVKVIEWQFDPTSLVEIPKKYIAVLGCPAPQMPMQIGGQQVTPNLNGYAPSAGRAYAWTLYNPNTLRESAIAPFISKPVITETDNGNAMVTINGSILLPLPTSALSTKYSSYQSYYAAIPATMANLSVAYTCIRVYATKDGGITFYLVTTLFDDLGNQISNTDGSVPIALLQSLQIARGWTDYVPVPEAQAAQASFRVYEGSGPINFAPDPVNLGTTAWTAQTPSNPANNQIYVASGAAPDGSNAFEADAPYTSGTSTWISAGIPVKNQTYYFQMFLDKSQATGGTMEVTVITPSGTVLATLGPQTDNIASTLNATFTPSGGQKTVKIRIIAKGAISIAADASITWANPVLQVGSALNSTPTNYPTPDASLVTPAPAALTNYPPPIASAVEVVNDALHLVDATDGTKIWYTEQGNFEAMGANSFVRTNITKNADQVFDLVADWDRLLVCKGRAIQQISSYPPAEPVGVDPQHGILARRASIVWGSSIISLLTHGLGQVKLATTILEDKLNVGVAAELFGDDIKPLVDAINPVTLRGANGLMLPNPALLNKFDLYLLAYQVGNVGNDNVLMYYLGRSAGFSRLTALPNNSPIITLKEIQTTTGGTGAWPLAGNGDYAIIALTNDAKSYVMFAGAQDGTVTATVVTQPLPTPADLPGALWNTRKIFQSLIVEGEDLGNWKVSYSTDSQFNPDGTVASYPWTNKSIINNVVELGIPGQQIVFKFTHSAVSAMGITPLLSKFVLDYDIEGDGV